MTTYLVDTNTVSYVAKGRSPAARARLEALDEDDRVCISAITEAELRYGLARRPGARTLHSSIAGLLFKFQVLPWGSRESAAYGDLRARLESAGETLSELDMLIAAQTIAAGAVLVTSDRALARVRGLRAVENWATDV